jgi:hypothetical protein
MTFAGEDLLANADLSGLVAFLFACFSAGTPELDEFAGARSQERSRLARQAFLSDLPTRMLSLENGAAQAVVGHVERAWGYSFNWKGSSQASDPRTFQYTLHEMMLGRRLGYALEHLNQRYVELASLLAYDLTEVKFNPQYDANRLALHWIGAHDARGYAVLGDPAVRLIPPALKSQSNSTIEGGQG